MLHTDVSVSDNKLYVMRSATLFNIRIYNRWLVRYSLVREDNLSSLHFYLFPLPFKISIT